MSTFLSSLFQKKCLVKSQDYHEEEFVSIEHDSESENSKSTIYMMPRPAIDSAKIFVPQ